MAENEPVGNPYKVKLTAAAQFGRTVSFDASPTISENRNVNYNSLEPLHAPGQIQVYKNTSSRNFQISDIKLLSRTMEEADRNLKKLWLLRSWCMPRFGASSTLSSEEINTRSEFEAERQTGTFTEERLKEFYGTEVGVELLGAPPAVLYLSAYSKNVGSSTVPTGKEGRDVNVWNVSQHINKVPVVIQQLTIPYPNDVDYITTTKGVPMPLIMNIDLALLETHSPNGYEGFNLDAFKQGVLQGF